MREKLPEQFTVDQVLSRLEKKGYGFNHTQVRQALSRMSRRPYNELERWGNQRNRFYSFINVQEAPVRPLPILSTRQPPEEFEDPLEILLDAMAKAEPIIRRMIEARKLLVEGGET